MVSIWKTLVAAVAVSALAASMATAAPAKKHNHAEKGCATCCAAGPKAHTDAYVSCCEVGNKGFFPKHCKSCCSTSPQLEVSKAGLKGCCKDGCAGNGAFFTAKKHHACHATNAFACHKAGDTCCAAGDHKKH